MLRLLRIRHLAVIDQVEVEFGPGLNVLTGETGAGKSILVGAVGLLLGGRASGDLVRTGEETAVVEALFERPNGVELLVRREISNQGRSRAFVDGAIATVAMLKDLAGELIELHGQHEHQTLLDPVTHLSVIDAFGGLTPLQEEVAARHEAMHGLAERLATERRRAADRTAQQDYLAYQYEELERASLRAGEDVELAATRQLLASATRVEQLCRESYAALYDSDSSVLSQLVGVWRRVSELSTFDSQFQTHMEARDAIKSQLEDLASVLRRYADTIDASPARLAATEERLSLLEQLKRKHGPTLDDVLRKRDVLKAELADARDGEGRLIELQRLHAAARDGYLNSAHELTEERRRVSGEFSREIEQLLGQLALEGTCFEVRFGPELDEQAWTPRGVNTLEFYVSTNRGEDVRPLTRVVSGGELSRIMLAVKTLTFRARLTATSSHRTSGQDAPGLIFDEVDAGIGGGTADVVGRKLHSLGAAFQVLCITHLPQIAAYADAHFQIAKSVHAGRTMTRVVQLDDNSRVEELGRMLAGGGVSDGIRASAREMIAVARGASVERIEHERRKRRSEGETVNNPQLAAAPRRRPIT